MFTQFFPSFWTFIVIRQLLIVSDLQTNSELFLQGLIGLKIRLYAMPSPTTNDCDSYYIVWSSIV